MWWQLRDRKSRHVTGSELEVTSFDRKSPGSGSGRLKTQALCRFELHQGCNSQEVEVTGQGMTSRHFT